jgi:hypothetical protein
LAIGGWIAESVNDINFRIGATSDAAIRVTPFTYDHLLARAKRVAKRILTDELDGHERPDDDRTVDDERAGPVPEPEGVVDVETRTEPVDARSEDGEEDWASTAWDGASNGESHGPREPAQESDDDDILVLTDPIDDRVGPPTGLPGESVAPPPGKRREYNIPGS